MKNRIITGLILTISLITSSCSSDSNDASDNNFGIVSYKINGKLVEYTKANSYITGQNDITFIFADDNDSSIGLTLTMEDLTSTLVADSTNAETISALASYKGNETNVVGYDVNSIYIELPSLNRKGNYSIKVNPISSNKASGTFSFVAYSEDNKDSVVVTDGTFRDIPNLMNQ
jgi:hypothetical protein